jgi:Predicted membrane protein
MTRRFASFLAAGAVAALANWGSRFACSRWMSFEAAVVAAYCVGMVVAFTLMRAFVFAAGERPVAVQAGRFAVVNLLALAQTFVVTVLLAEWVLPAMGLRDHVEALAHLVGVAVPVVTSYIGHRAYTFR